jgi:hypothetical protein
VDIVVSARIKALAKDTQSRDGVSIHAKPGRDMIGQRSLGLTETEPDIGNLE